jgi:hypothetical protein
MMTEIEVVMWVGSNAKAILCKIKQFCVVLKVKEKKEALLFLGRLSYSENTIWKYCSLCLMTTRERLCRGMNQVYKAPLIGIILIF